MLPYLSTHESSTVDACGPLHTDHIMERKIWFNGTLLPASQANVSVYDHGLLYGDGVFEGIRQYNGRVFEKTAHLKRLFESAHAIRLPIPYTPDQLAQAIEDTLVANNLQDSYIRLVVTRGPGTLGISPQNCGAACTFIIADSIQMYPADMYATGMSIITASTTRTHPNSLSPKIKSLNYLNNVMAKWEAIDAGVPEAVMLNHLGFVCECTGDNIFIVKNNRLITPPEESGILIGVTRQTIIDLALTAGIPVDEKNLTRYDLYIADECFLTGTGAEVIPVTKIDTRIIGSGTPGPLTQQLMTSYRKKVRSP